MTFKLNEDWGPSQPGVGPAASGSVLMPISDQEFNLMRELIYRRFGINLSDQKRSLLVGRLQKLLKQWGFGSFRDYYDHLLNDKSERALGELVDRISTNHTYFNREKDHFDFFLKTALPTVVTRLRKENRKDLRVWCAGCSSGEESYMLVMLMMEYLGREYSQWSAGVLATDISDRVLSIARNGIYPEDRVKQVPESFQRRFFSQVENDQWEVDAALKKEVTYRRFNLMNRDFPFKKPFQIIFCRNVMIYFDQPTRETLIRKFHQFTEPGGYLFIGHSETIGRNQNLYKYLMPATYQKDG